MAPTHLSVCASTEKPRRQEERRRRMILSVLTAQLFDDFLDIFPNQLFVCRVAQQIGGMKRRHQFDSMIADASCRAAFVIGTLLCSSVCTANLPKPTMIFGANEIDLFLEKRLAGRDLVRLGIAIFRRPAFDDIGDIDVLALEPHAFGDDIGEQLAGPADERLALQIFVTPRPFADEHQAWPCGLPTPKTRWVRPDAKLAAPAVADGRAQLFEALGLGAVDELIGKEITFGIPLSKFAFLSGRRLHSFGRFTLGQKSDPGAFLPLQMAPQRCSQRGKFVPVAVSPRMNRFLSRDGSYHRRVGVAITPNAPNNSRSSSQPAFVTAPSSRCAAR